MLYELTKDLRDYVRGATVCLVDPKDVEAATAGGWEFVAVVGAGEVSYVRGQSYIPVLRPSTLCLLVKKKAPSGAVV